MARKNRTGRSARSLSPFVAIERYVMRTLAWDALSAFERAAYLEISAHYVGDNNGRLAVSCLALGRRLHVSKSTASRAISRLEALGFLERVRGSGFNVKGRTASEYRLTALRCDVTGALPSKSFNAWKPLPPPNVVPIKRRLVAA